MREILSQGPLARVKGSTCCSGSRQALVCGSKHESYHCSKRARRRAGRWKDGTENELEGEGRTRLLVMVIKVDPFAKLLEITTR